MDLVYVVRPGANPELRYSLRSVAANLPHDRVWIVGHAPAWVTGCTVVPVEQKASKWENVCVNWLTFMDRRDAPRQFVLMNDDFFITEPVDSIPVWHRGPLDVHAKQQRAGTGESGYGDGLARTVEHLRFFGVAEPLSYELHVPLVVDRRGWWDAVKAKRQDSRLAPRSIYANMAKLGGVEHDDVKVRTGTEDITGPFVSTDESHFGWCRAGVQVRELFPEPGPYERTVRS